jgi:hypothetical protein
VPTLVGRNRERSKYMGSSFKKSTRLALLKEHPVNDKTALVTGGEFTLGHVSK